MLAAPMIASTRVFSGLSDMELYACLLGLRSSPSSVHMSAVLEILRKPPNLECGLPGFEHYIHKQSIRVMAQFNTLKQLRQTMAVETVIGLIRVRKHL